MGRQTCLTGTYQQLVHQQTDFALCPLRLLLKMQSLGSVCHGWSGICFFIKICASIDIIVWDLISCMRHTGHLEGVIKPHDKIILHAGIRDGLPRLTDDSSQDDVSSIVSVDFWCRMCGNFRIG